MNFCNASDPLTFEKQEAHPLPSHAKVLLTSFFSPYCIDSRGHCSLAYQHLLLAELFSALWPWKASASPAGTPMSPPPFMRPPLSQWRPISLCFFIPS
jgi:hypothetical protein